MSIKSIKALKSSSVFLIILALFLFPQYKVQADLGLFAGIVLENMEEDFFDNEEMFILPQVTPAEEITPESQIKETPVLVVIDPGHGGRDSGALYGKILEKTINLKIGLKLKTELEARKIGCLMTRESDVFVDLYKRSYVANKNNATLFVSIHNNYIPGHASQSGTETLYYPSKNKEGLSGKTFAEMMQKKLVNGLKMKNHGVISRPNLVVLRATTMPACLVEVGYLSNKSDRERVGSDGFQAKAAALMAEVIEEALVLKGAYKNDDGVWVIIYK